MVPSERTADQPTTLPPASCRGASPTTSLELMKFPEAVRRYTITVSTSIAARVRYPAPQAPAKSRQHTFVDASTPCPIDQRAGPARVGELGLRCSDFKLSVGPDS